MIFEHKYKKAETYPLSFLFSSIRGDPFYNICWNKIIFECQSNKAGLYDDISDGMSDISTSEAYGGDSNAFDVATITEGMIPAQSQGEFFHTFVVSGMQYSSFTNRNMLFDIILLNINIVGFKCVPTGK